VPALTGTFEDMLEQYFHQHPVIVTSDTDTGLTLVTPTQKKSAATGW